MYFEPDLWSDEFRGCGRTTDQLLGSPEGTVFVAYGRPEHTVRLAKSLGRADINVVNVAWVQQERYLGRRGALVVDHQLCRYPPSHLVGEQLLRAFAYFRA